MTVAILGRHKNFSSHGSFKLDRVDKFSLGKLDHLCQLKRNLGDLSGRKRTFSKSSQKYGLCLLSKPCVLPFPEIMSVSLSSFHQMRSRKLWAIQTVFGNGSLPLLPKKFCAIRTLNWITQTYLLKRLKQFLKHSMGLEKTRWLPQSLHLHAS